MSDKTISKDKDMITEADHHIKVYKIWGLVEGFSVGAMISTALIPVVLEINFNWLAFCASSLLYFIAAWQRVRIWSYAAIIWSVVNNMVFEHGKENNRDKDTEE